MEEGFEKLRKQLEQLEWPDVYIFKFIIPSTHENIAKIHALFDETALINQKESDSKKYTVFTIKTVMLNADSIIDVYLKASEIKGIVSL